MSASELESSPSSGDRAALLLVASKLAQNALCYGREGGRLRVGTHLLEGSGQSLHPDLLYLEAEVRWAARIEQARTVEDVLSRRTRALLINARVSSEAAPRVAQILAEELGHSQAWEAAQVEAYRVLARGYQLEHPLPRL